MTFKSRKKNICFFSTQTSLADLVLKQIRVPDSDDYVVCIEFNSILKLNFSIFHIQEFFLFDSSGNSIYQDSLRDAVCFSTEKKII